jgi:threonine/homoserine/homoserine lactone efflux protein
METSLGLFLLSVAGISLTGVMLPGPMTAATVAKGYRNKNAGALIAIGHGVIELPLIAAMYLGIGHFLGLPAVVNGIYIAGGVALFYLGFRMFRTAGDAPEEVGGLPASSVVTGILVTGTNPAFYVWWVTIGAALIAGAARFGVIGIVLLAVVHWPCDLVWSEFLSMGTFKSRRWWTGKVQRIVFSVCALVLLGFGAWFVFSGLSNL